MQKDQKRSGLKATYSYVQQKKPRTVTFGFMDPDEILRMSVCQIFSERVYDDVTLLPKLNGVNDPRMGCIGRDQHCLTCFGDMVDCPGHFGHIELAMPVFHPGLIDGIRKVLKVVCYNCSRLLVDDQDDRKRYEKITYPKQRFYKILSDLEKSLRRKCSADPEHGGCGYIQPKYMRRSLSLTVEHFDNTAHKTNQKLPLLADEVYQIFQKIKKEDQILMGVENPHFMIIKRLAVCPPAVRPSVEMGSLMRSEDDLTYCYQAIIKHNNILRQQLEKGGNQTTVNELLYCLQYYVATLMDNNIAGQPTHKHKSGKPLKAIKERLKGKEGRIRNNLMGKRVDFSARSVITPDPSLSLDQLGVPIKVAINMTIPETVTQHNIDEMRNLVANGPAVWPGAKYIQRLDGGLIDLSLMNCRTDAHLEYGYVVERHLKNNDYVLFNRQPSLHKMSTMGHRIKVLPYSTFRLNLSVTTPYNADFDGDEMNMFVPQSLETKAEVKEIMHVPRQIVSPQSNKPVMGIVQDSLLGIMMFTRRETFLEKAIVMQLLMQLEDMETQFYLPTPAIIKPKPLWTGKQIISILLPQVNLIRNQSQKTNGQTDYCPTRDKMVLIQNGEHLAGELTKQIVGSAAGGIIHVIFKDRGFNSAKDFLSNAQKVINQWLVYQGHTVGIQDACPSTSTKEAIAQTLSKHKKKVQKIINQAHSGDLIQQPGKNMVDSFEHSVNQELNEARDRSGTLAFKNLDQHNKIQNMVQAGSKGTNINISQIMACVGQQNVEGKRIPFGFGGQRSLPHFGRGDYGPESKGFVSSNYIEGLDPHEFYFHGMGGREGLIDTAVKTAETGYIQRRLVKALEDVMIKYDSTVRNSQNGLVQFVYGEDGMAGEQIEDQRLDLLKLSDQELKKRYQYTASKQLFYDVLDLQVVDEVMRDEKVQAVLDQEYEQIVRDRQFLREAPSFKQGDDVTHLPLNLPRLILSCKQIFGLKPRCLRQGASSSLKPQYIVSKVKELCSQLSVYPNHKGDPHTNETNSMSTQLSQIYIRSHLASKRLLLHDQFTEKAFDWLLGEIRCKFENSLIHAGEVIGSIAAHSLGEPATQMTLNTFHFAGVSSKNVTLGVPRLKEIINVAKNLKTPTMQIYLQPKARKDVQNVQKVQGLIEFTTLADLVDSSQIFYDPDYANTVVEEDKLLVQLYSEVQVPDENDDVNSPWVLRLVLSKKKMLIKQVEIDFVEEKLTEKFGNFIQIMHSDTNASLQVMRIRLRGLRDEDEESAVQLLKECEQDILHEIMLKGIPEITKVYAKKYSELEYTPSGEVVNSQDNWMLETDGVCLQKILGCDLIDHQRTISNDIIEIRQILGIEAARQALVNEIRGVFGAYGIYVNYRHLATLCDVMTQKGKLTSITRHGINRLDSGPLRKCSFEETVEILLEASMHNEKDPLKGVTENIIMGQLAPIGTGSFEVILDQKQLIKHAQEVLNIWNDEEICGTPVMMDEYGNYNGNMTPCVGETPYQMHGGRTSEYIAMTPGQSVHEAQFSPGFNQINSPGYLSPYNGLQSPGYGSPTSPGYVAGRVKQQSPIYNNFVSPIYNAPNVRSPEVRQSPNYRNNVDSVNAQSPNYSPGSRQSPYNMGAMNSGGQSGYQQGVVKSNYSPSYSPSANACSPASPNYSPANKQQSPNYSPSLTAHGGYSIQSPNYSPSGGNSGYQSQNQQMPIKQNYSPSYSPSLGGYHKSPAYSPQTNQSPQGQSVYQQKSPGVQVHSPRVDSPYVPAMQAGVVKPAYMPNIQRQQSPTYCPKSPVYKEEQKDK